MKIGILDVGGGFRCCYSAGVYDYLIEQDYFFDYYIGISAGSGNLVSFLGRQHGRNLRYYLKHCADKRAMGVSSFLKTGCYLNLKYIYGEMSNIGGVDPVDYPVFSKNAHDFNIAVTNAASGKQEFFTEKDLAQNSYMPIAASCCLPVASKPIEIDGKLYFDGGISEPIPYKKAFDEGCDKLVVLLSRPLPEPNKQQKDNIVLRAALKKYPKTYETLMIKHNKYNKAISELKELEKEGKAILVAPHNTYNIAMLSKDIEAMTKIYNDGYEDAKALYEKIKC